jgi:hypothetical protein
MSRIVKINLENSENTGVERITLALKPDFNMAALFIMKREFSAALQANVVACSTYRKQQSHCSQTTAIQLQGSGVISAVLSFRADFNMAAQCRAEQEIYLVLKRHGAIKTDGRDHSGKVIPALQRFDSKDYRRNSVEHYRNGQLQDPSAEMAAIQWFDPSGKLVGRTHYQDNALQDPAPGIPALQYSDESESIIEHYQKGESRDPTPGVPAFQCYDDVDGTHRVLRLAISSIAGKGERPLTDKERENFLERGNFYENAPRRWWGRDKG